MQINKTILEHSQFKVHALSFIPDSIESRWIACFTHGYTSHKGSVMPWANRLAESGIPCIIFDQPGHYLGSYNEVESFADFTSHAHELFELASIHLQKQLDFKPEGIILGGHSLGALTCLKAVETPYFKTKNTFNIAVGFGLNLSHDTHLFDTVFYQKTLAIRNQLVSPKLDKDDMFPWIKQEKQNLMISDKKIYLLCGEDDLVVSVEGAKYLANSLENLGNTVYLEIPKKLAHHQPENAAPHINAALKKYLFK